MTNERWLKWAVGRYYRSLGYKVSMKPAHAGNAMVDGVAVTPEGERIAIEVKSPSDDIIRGIGQCFEALAAGYVSSSGEDSNSSASTRKHASTDMIPMDGVS